MATETLNQKVDIKPLNVALSYNAHSNNFFVDFWEQGLEHEREKYLVSIKITEAVALAISRELGIEILM